MGFSPRAIERIILSLDERAEKRAKELLCQDEARRRIYLQSTAGILRRINNILIEWIPFNLGTKLGGAIQSSIDYINSLNDITEFSISEWYDSLRFRLTDVPPAISDPDVPRETDHDDCRELHEQVEQFLLKYPEFKLFFPGFVID